MARRPSWSWADVATAAKQAAEPADTRITVRVSAASYGQLLIMARAAGTSPNQVAASIIDAVIQDDAAAHAEARR